VEDYRLKLNFEAIGRTGPSIMFETGPDSGRVVRGFGRAARYPVAQSWLSSQALLQRPVLLTEPGC
jgi:hypothetical protein